MALLTKNSTASQAVLWTACLLSGVGLYFDPSDTLFATGLALVCFGMIQAYYGTVAEVELSMRLPYIVLGIPLVLGFAYLAFIGLRQYLDSWAGIGLAATGTLGIQLIVSLAATQVWIWRSRIDDARTER